MTQLLAQIDELSAFITTYDEKSQTEPSTTSFVTRASRTDLLVHAYSRTYIPSVLIFKILIFFGEKLEMVAIGFNLNGEFGMNSNHSITSKYELLSKMWKHQQIDFVNSYIVQSDGMNLIYDKKSNKIYCAGNNYFGQCGINSNQNEKIFPLTKNDWNNEENITNISEGVVAKSILYVTNTQKIYLSGRRINCFNGNNNSKKNYGIFYASKMTQFFISKNLTIKKICCGTDHILVLCTNGQIFSCGENSVGQCGILSKNNENIHDLTLVSGLKNYCYDIGCLCASNLCLCAPLNSNNTKECFKELWVFGDDSSCELGLVDFVESDYESDEIDETEEMKYEGCTRIPTLNEYFEGYKLKEIVCGAFHSMVITTEGECIVFGDNEDGQLGEDEDGTIHINEINIENEYIVKGFCGYYHNVLITNTNKLYTFGSNEYNECSILNEETIIKEIYCLTRDEIGITKNSFFVNIIAGINSTMIVYQDEDQLY